MKLAYSICDDSKKIDKLSVFKESIKFEIGGDKYVIDKSLVQRFLSESELSETNNLYVFVGEEGDIRLRNKLLETEVSKRGGDRYLNGIESSMRNIGQIYMPFSDCKMCDATFRVNLSEESAKKIDLTYAERVENNHEAYKAFAKKTLPKLHVLSSEKTDYWHEIKVQVTLNQEEVLKSGIIVYAKTDSGYLNKTRATTDDNGIATFKFSPMLLDAGDKSIIKFGFRHFSNIDRIEIKA